MNSQLYTQDKHYTIPKEILARIQSKLYTSKGNSEGIKRAKNLLKTGYCSYPLLKRLKNFFDYLDPKTQTIEFELAGGDLMRQFVEKTLQSEREKTRISNQNKVVSAPPSAMDNTLRGASGDVNMDLNESSSKKKNNALAVIINEDDKILIVKRSPYKESWMPNKYALVGGGIEEGEEPIDAVKREVMEECAIKINNFLGSLKIKSTPDIVDHIFIAKFPEKEEIKLNEEHTKYGWYSLDEINDLDAVPKLYEYIELALNKIK